MSRQCTHLTNIPKVKPRTPNGCATRHFHATHHSVGRSLEPREDWGWCSVDDAFLQASQATQT